MLDQADLLLREGDSSLDMGKPYAAVLSRAVGKMAQPNERKLVTDLATRLGIERVIWRD